MQTVAEWKASQNSVKSVVPSPTVNSAIQTPAEWKASQQRSTSPSVQPQPVSQHVGFDFNKFKGQTISPDTGQGIPATDYRARFVAPIDMLPPLARPARALIDSVKGAHEDLYKRFDDLSASVTDPRATKLDKATKVASVGLGLFNTLFTATGVPSAIAVAEQVPGLDVVAKGVNKLFHGAGTVGSNVGNVLVDKLPVSDQAKETIRPVMQEFFALLSQFALGKVAHDTVRPRLDTLVTKINETIQNDTTVPKSEIMTPKEWVDAGKPITSVASQTITPIEAKPIMSPKEWVAAGKPVDTNIKPTTIEKPISQPSVSISPEVLAKEGEAISNIHTQFELSQPGYRLMAQDGGGFSGSVPSTFPKWVPEDLRSTALFNKVKDIMGDGKSLDSITIPPERNVKQRALLSEVLSELERQNIDVSRIKNKLNEQTTTAIRGGNEGATAIRKGEISTEEILKQFEKPTEKPIAEKAPEIKAPTQVPTDNTFKSRVFERLQAEHPDVLKGDVLVEKLKLTEDNARATELLKLDKQKAFEIAMNREISSDVTSTATNIVMSEKALADGNYGLYERLVRNRSLAQTRRGQEIVSERGSLSDNSTSRYVKELVSTRLSELGKKYLSNLTDKVKGSSNKERALKAVDNEVAKLEKRIKNKKLDVRTALDLLDKLACI